MRKIKKPLASFFFILVICSVCSCREKSRLPVRELTIEKQNGEEISVSAEIAVKAEERNRGFMFRTEIPDGSGMLFVFEKDQILHFWMKNTPHPLSIAYIDRSGKIRDIFDMTPFSESSVSSTVSVLYALEVPQGYFERVGVKKGDRLKLSGLSF